MFAPGEILGLYGLMGAGRTELLESLLGVHDDARGSVRLDGRELAGSTCGERIARGIAMVPEDRQTSGLVPTMTVQQNMTLAHRRRAVAARLSLAGARSDAAASEWATQPARQDAGARCADRFAERRQSAEGRDRAERHDPARACC